MVTLPSVDMSQMLLSTFAWIQVLVPKVAAAIKERLDQGDSPEAILRELIRSAGETTEDEGLAHLWSALYYLAEGQSERALDECSAARRAWPDGSPIIQLFEAHALLPLRRYDEAFSSFAASHRTLWPVYQSLQEASYLSPYVEQRKVDLYERWALVGVVQGLEGLLALNLGDLEKGGEKVVAVLQQARADGQEETIWSTITQVEQSLSSEQQRQVQEFRDFVRLIAIEDPFEGLRALAKRISKVWPQDIDCVEAVREQRK